MHPLLAALALATTVQGPLTRAEKTDYRETSHYSDVISFIQELQGMGGPISLQYTGTSTEGKAMPLVICAKPMVASAADARRSGKAIVYIQANIHAGEVEGKEAALIILRRLTSQPKVLDHLILLVNPIYNIDGNEKFGPVARNRPEQDGPDVVGVRPNGQNLDLNRDCMKAESPEMRSVLETIYGKWNPDVVMDLHTTDGTRHGFELTYSPPLNPNTDSAVMKFSRDELLPAIRGEMRSKYGNEFFDYGNGERRNNVRSWYTFGQEGRYVTNYAGIRNRIGILSEATTFIPFKARIEATDHFVWSMLEYLDKRSARVVAMTREADLHAVEAATKAPSLGVRFDFADRGDEEVPIEKLAKGEAPGEKRPKAVEKIKMRIFDRFKVTKTAKLPAAYIFSGSLTSVADLLRRHGVVVEKLDAEFDTNADTFVLSELNQSPSAFQGHKLVRLEGMFQNGQLNASPGSYLVRTAQPLSTLIFHLLEPESLDGVAAWGFLEGGLSKERPFPIAKVFGSVNAVSTRIP